MPRELDLTSSLEDYLEAIYHRIQHNQGARVKDLADVLNVKKSSVTVALRALAGKQLIQYSPYSEILLTPEGERAAKDILRRHETLKAFFMEVLGVPEPAAEDTACRMEHVLSHDITERFWHFMEFIDRCPLNGPMWRKRFREECNQPFDPKHCLTCQEEAKGRLKHAMALAPQPAETLPLSELHPGIKAQIVKITHKGLFRKRLLEMGVTTGALLSIERVAPLGDPIDIKIRGYHLSLRKEEAANIEVKRIVE